MKTVKYEFLRIIVILIISVINIVPSFCQSSSEMFTNGLTMADKAVGDGDISSFEDGLKIMVKAQKKDRKRADWCYEIGCRYYFNFCFGNDIICLDKDKGREWLKESAKLGDLKSAIILFKDFRPKSEPHILAPKREWKQYFKHRDLCMVYAGIALQADIPTAFNDYIALGDAAWFTHNDNLAHKFFAKAADNGEYGAMEYVIRDERALDYLTTPKAMFDAGIEMWQRGKDNDIYGHNDKLNGFRMFEKSAKMNYPEAQNQMGYIYLKGITVAPDTLKAISWYKLAAKNNNPAALSALGKLYINGQGIERDIEKGFCLLNKSEQNGHINSKLFLGYCYLYGLGISQDPQKARTLFQEYFDCFQHFPDQKVIIVDNRVIDIDYLIGLTYYYVNSSECLRLLEASLKSDSFVHLQRSDALVKLASCYQEGRCGADINIGKANELLKAALQYGGTEINSGNIIL